VGDPAAAAASTTSPTSPPVRVTVAPSELVHSGSELVHSGSAASIDTGTGTAGVHARTATATAAAAAATVRGGERTRCQWHGKHGWYTVSGLPNELVGLPRSRERPAERPSHVIVDC
jgi:hypothetical protein